MMLDPSYQNSQLLGGIHVSIVIHKGGERASQSIIDIEHSLSLNISYNKVYVLPPSKNIGIC
jgi:hypothetical protein